MSSNPTVDRVASPSSDVTLWLGGAKRSIMVKEKKVTKEKVNSSLKVETNPGSPIFDEINEMVNNQSTHDIIN